MDFYLQKFQEISQNNFKILQLTHCRIWRTKSQEGWLSKCINTKFVYCSTTVYKLCRYAKLPNSVKFTHWRRLEIVNSNSILYSSHMKHYTFCSNTMQLKIWKPAKYREKKTEAFNQDNALWKMSWFELHANSAFIATSQSLNF